MPVTDIDTYKQKETNLQNPDLVAKAGPDNVARLKNDMRLFRSNNPQLFAGMSSTPEGVGAGTPLDKLQQQTNESSIAESNNTNALTGMNSWLDNSNTDTANVIRDAMGEEALRKRREATDFSKKLTRDESLKTASKLKVFNNPPEYFPPTLQGNPFSTSLLKPTTRYFEPTTGEFRQIAAEDKRIAARLQEAYPDQDIATLPDSAIEGSDAYKIYSDARWQHALADAVKSRTPIARVAYTDKDWMGGGQAKDVEGKPIEGQRKASIADLMDGTMAGGVGALQGGSLGGYDAGLTAIGAKDLRNEGRGSQERHPVLNTIGEVFGALNPRGLPSKLVGGLGGIGRPTSLLGRVAKGAAVGAATAVIDQNSRAAAKLAADAMDSDKSIADGVASVWHGLPGIQPQAVGLGATVGGGADLLGAGAGALARKTPRALGLSDDLAHLEASGGKISSFGSPKIIPEDRAITDLAASKRTTAQDLISEDAVQPLAHQALLDQEEALRQVNQATNVAQTKLEGASVDPKPTANAIRAEAQSEPAITSQAKAQRRQLLDLADSLDKAGPLTPEKLDVIMRQVDDAAKHGRGSSAPVEHYNFAGKKLKELRDQFAHMDEQTVADVVPPEDKGLFTVDQDPTIAEPQARVIAGIRDPEGGVKPVEGYSELKARQYKDRKLQAFKNARALGISDAKGSIDLKAEPVFSEPIVDKGLFNPETPEEVVSKIKPKVSLNTEQHGAIKRSVRNIARPDNLADTEETLSLAKRAGIEPQLRVIQRLDDTDKLASALGGAIKGVSARGGNLGAFLSTKQLFRTVPTLKSLSGGLPSAPSTEASGWSVNRLKEFVSQFPNRLPKAAKMAAEGARKGLGSKDVQATFMPSKPSLGLRAGLPARALSAEQDKPSESKEKFSPEETEFWIKVIQSLGDKAEKVAAQ